MSSVTFATCSPITADVRGAKQEIGLPNSMTVPSLRRSTSENCLAKRANVGRNLRSSVRRIVNKRCPIRL
jgi:hypothetical protein